MRARAGRLGLAGDLFVGAFERSCISDLRPFVLRASARELELLRGVSIGSPFHASYRRLKKRPWREVALDIDFTALAAAHSSRIRRSLTVQKKSTNC